MCDVRFKTVVLLLWIHCILLLTLFWVGVFDPCFVMQYLVSIPVFNHLTEEKIGGCLILVVFMLVFCLQVILICGLS